MILFPKTWAVENQESIMEFYLKTTIRSGLIRSPFRLDKNPTCGFYYSKSKRLYLHDFATGEHFDVFEIVKRKYGLSFPRALDKMLEDKDKFLEAKVELNEPTLEYIPSSTTNYSYFEKFGISTKTLNFYDVHNVRAVYVEENLSWRATEKNPIFVYKFPTGNFKLYRPLSADKTKKWKSSCSIKDVSGYYQLPAKGKICFITSSLKDVMVLHELGYPAIAFSSEAIPTKGENAKFVKSVVDQLRSRFDRVVFFMDNDGPGKEYSSKLSKHYSIDSILIPDNEPKDISDYYAKYNRRKTRAMLNKQIKKLIQHEIADFDAFVAANSTVLDSTESSPFE